MHSGGCSGFNDSTYAAARSGSVDDYGANTLLIGTVHRDAAVLPSAVGANLHCLEDLSRRIGYVLFRTCKGAADVTMYGSAALGLSHWHWHRAQCERQVPASVTVPL